MPEQPTESIIAPSDPRQQPAPDRAIDERKIRVALVDDDDRFREIACGELEYLGFDVESYLSGEQLFEAHGDSPEPDVIVVDWKLNAGLGPALLSRMRRLGIAKPVVFYTGLPTTTYESAALDCGAVDFVDKARGTPILAKRLRRIVEWRKEHSEGGEPQPLRLGRLALRSEVAAAFWDSNNVGLTLTEFNVVHLLASHAGEYLNYRAIYDCVHHEGFVAGDGENGFRTNVRSLIKRVRNKFRAFDADFSEIENFAALGYRWRNAPAADG